ncbi:MAG: flagellar basal body rod protein FlgB [Thermomicrobiales bacterium]
MARIDATEILQQSLDGLSMRQRATANNIANVDTPGYKATQVSFENQLAQAVDAELSRRSGIQLAATDPAHLSAGPRGLGQVEPVVSRLDEMSYRNDENSVDIEREMALLAETQLRYSTLSSLVSRRLAIERNIVRGGN